MGDRRDLNMGCQQDLTPHCRSDCLSLIKPRSLVLMTPSSTGAAGSKSLLQLCAVLLHLQILSPQDTEAVLSSRGL
jgi:hypothetical protein